nr:aminotransferase class V-fold PLP-dependent enzyme [Pannonibacter sp. XCT-34]
MLETHDMRNSGSGLDLSILPRVINVNGTMTSLGASIMVPEAIAALQEIAPRFVPMHRLQREASQLIAELTGAEAGFVTASAAAGLSLAIAATMTGLNPGRAEQLPDTTGMKNRVAIQLGHMCHYGAAVDQSIRLAGAIPVPVGQSTQALDHQLEHALAGGDVAAALYVVSHHVVEYGQIPLDRFVAIAHAHGVPVIVDGASEYDLRRFLQLGADVAIYSGHKFLGGPTSGIVAGRRDLVRAAYLQNIGIGRGMKVGKESIWGVMAALNAWKTRDHDGIRAREQAALDLWQNAVAPFPGVTARRNPDPTGNPLDRLRLDIDARVLGASALAIVRAMATLEIPVILRDHEVELGWIQLDPCNLHPGDAEIVAESLVAVLTRARAGALPEPDVTAHRNGGILAYLNPDLF